MTCDAIFDPKYQQSSRARWLCTLETALRILFAAMMLVRHGRRRHLNFVLRIGPPALLNAGALVQENTEAWRGEWSELLWHYLEPVETLLWEGRRSAEPDTRRLNYIRCAVAFTTPLQREQ